MTALRDWWQDDESAFVLKLLSGIAVALFCLGWAINHLALPGSLAEIEQLRSDAAAVDDPRSEDVIGQVTQWNQTIRSSQAYNKIPVLSLMVPDEWDSVEIIEIGGVR